MPVEIKTHLRFRGQSIPTIKLLEVVYWLDSHQRNIIPPNDARIEFTVRVPLVAKWMNSGRTFVCDASGSQKLEIELGLLLHDQTLSVISYNGPPVATGDVDLDLLFSKGQVRVLSAKC